MSKKRIILFSRLALFIIYFWFGALKVFYESPANPLVESLLQKTLPFLTFQQFIIWFGIFEMVIGVLFLIGKYKRLTSVLFVAHMVMTFMPLFLLPQTTWTRAWVPTLEGQYIIKNFALIVLFLNVFFGSRD